MLASEFLPAEVRWKKAAEKGVRVPTSGRSVTEQKSIPHRWCRSELDTASRRIVGKAIGCRCLRLSEYSECFA